MFHYAKESGDEQEIGSKDLKFNEISVVSVMTGDPGCIPWCGGTPSTEEKGPHNHTALVYPRVSPGADAAEQWLLAKSPPSP